MLKLSSAFAFCDRFDSFVIVPGKRVAETMCYSYLQEGMVDVRAYKRLVAGYDVLLPGLLC